MGYRLFFTCFHVLIACVLPVMEVVASGDAIEDPQALRAQVESFLHKTLRSEYLGTKPEDTQITVSKMDPRLRLPKCAEPIHQEIASSRPYGSNLSVKVTCDGNRSWAVYVPARVETYAEVAVLARSLERGTILTAADVTTARMNVAQAGTGQIRDADQAVGMELRRRLQAGEALRLTHLKSPQVVKKGERVVLEAGSGVISVVTSGTALANGQVGDQIRVRNENSNRVIDAEVIGPGKVRVVM